MENINTNRKKSHATLITDNFFILKGLLHMPELNINIIPCSTYCFINRVLSSDGLKVIDMDSWERFFMASRPSLRETIGIYHSNSLMFLAKNVRQEMVTELLYPEVKCISPVNCAKEIQRHLISKAPEPVRLLTPRQRQIMLLMSSGTGDKDICSILGISAKTLSTHLRSVLRKVSLKKFSHFCAAIIPYAQDVSAVCAKEITQLKNLSENTSCRKAARTYRNVLHAD
ncbi:helix-turn-helix transcriptional regulator (plasmid) [Pantoea agglomerans]|nr:helix-turn-helix transcriptional regulator [Pantoea agglomerans]WIL44514.1 helix-turn-helix transcriptional regulator [Pantoea agglomerans]